MVLASTLTAAPAFAQDFVDEPGPGVAIGGVSVKGHARLYDYRHWHNNNQPYPTQDPADRHDDRGTAVGGDLIMESGTLRGFSGGLSIYTQQALVHYDRENSSLAPHVTHFGEAFLRHQTSVSRLTAGRQLMQTPFANGDMFTMLPRAFQGISGALDFGGANVTKQRNDGADPFALNVLAPFADDAKPGAPDIKVYAARMNRYESRFGSHFTDENRYSSGLHAVDPAVPLATPGLFTAGLQYSQGFEAGDVLARLWGYNFFDYANMQFLEAGYQAKKLAGGARPYLRLQYIHESDSGASRAGNVHATYYGAKLGLEYGKAGVAVVFENAPSHAGAFRNGGLLHPYSDLSGVLYDDTLNNGLEDLGPGRALGLQVDYSPNKKFTVTTKYVRYLAYYGTNGAFYAYDGPAYFAGQGLIGGRLVRDNRVTNGISRRRCI
ncbi:MAG: hypothetical protein M3Y67_00110 [Pseudomonadota bacterium]|nr:hypothetical protein [Pseudomonadota bacterium]